MKRGEFLKNLGLSSAALMSFYCLGGVTGCVSESPSPQNPNTTGNGGLPTGLTGNVALGSGKIDFTVDLTNDNYKKLLTDGSFVYAGDVIVARVKGGSYAALAKACTHRQTSVEYRLNENDFWCSNHDSEFSLTGAVEKGPALDALKVFKTELTTNTLRVFEA